MMINTVVIQGRLTAEPEIKKLDTGASVCNFTLAVERFRRKNDSDEFTKITDFINCVAWQSRAAILSSFFHKGDLIAVTGSLQNDVFLDKKDDNRKRTITKIVVDKIHRCGFRAAKKSITSDDTDDSDLSDLSEEVKAEFLDDEDIPF